MNQYRRVGGPTPLLPHAIPVREVAALTFLAVARGTASLLWWPGRRWVLPVAFAGAMVIGFLDQLRLTGSPSAAEARALELAPTLPGGRLSLEFVHPGELRENLGRAFRSFPPHVLEQFVQGTESLPPLQVRSLLSADFDQAYGEINNYAGFYRTRDGVFLRCAGSDEAQRRVAIHEGVHAMADFLVPDVDGREVTFEHLVRPALEQHKRAQMGKFRQVLEEILADETMPEVEGVRTAAQKDEVRGFLKSIERCFIERDCADVEARRLARAHLTFPLLQPARRRAFLSDYAIYQDAEYAEAGCHYEFFAVAGEEFYFNPDNLRAVDPLFYAAFARLDAGLREPHPDVPRLADEFSALLIGR